MYVHHVDGAPQIIHMECSPIRRHADRPRTAHFDQVTPGAQFRTLADESPLSVVGDGRPAAATVQSFMDLDEAQILAMTGMAKTSSIKLKDLFMIKVRDEYCNNFQPIKIRSGVVQGRVV